MIKETKRELQPRSQKRETRWTWEGLRETKRSPMQDKGYWQERPRDQ